MQVEESRIKTLEVGKSNNKVNFLQGSDSSANAVQLNSWRSPNGSNFTNPQAPKTVQSEKAEFPLGAGKALKLYMGSLSDYEKREILDYRQVYFLGLEWK